MLHAALIYWEVNLLRIGITLFGLVGTLAFGLDREAISTALVPGRGPSKLACVQNLTKNALQETRYYGNLDVSAASISYRPTATPGGLFGTKVFYFTASEEQTGAKYRGWGLARFGYQSVARNGVRVFHCYFDTVYREVFTNVPLANFALADAQGNIAAQGYFGNVER